MKKLIVLIFTAVIIFAVFSTQRDKSVEGLAYVMALGIDKDGDNYSYTFQFAKPEAFGGNGENEGGENKDDDSPKNSMLENITIKTNSLYNAINLASRSLTREINCSHTALIVFSEEYTRENISENINTMIVSNTFSPDISVAVSKCKAEEYLKEVNPPLEKNPLLYYKKLFVKNYIENAPKATLSDFSYQNFVVALPLLGLNDEEIKSKNNTAVNGMAIIKNHTLVSTSKSDDAFCCRMLMGDIENYHYPTKKGNLYIKNIKVSGRKVKRTNDKVKIHLTLKINGSIETTQTKEAEQIIKDDFTKLAEDFLQKCSKEYKADVFGFYRYDKANHLTTKSLNPEKWQNDFENAEYEVIVKPNIIYDNTL